MDYITLRKGASTLAVEDVTGHRYIGYVTQMYFSPAEAPELIMATDPGLELTAIGTNKNEAWKLLREAIEETIRMLMTRKRVKRYFRRHGFDPTRRILYVDALEKEFYEKRQPTLLFFRFNPSRELASRRWQRKHARDQEDFS